MVRLIQRTVSDFGGLNHFEILDVSFRIVGHSTSKRIMRKLRFLDAHHPALLQNPRSSPHSVVHAQHGSAQFGSPVASTATYPATGATDGSKKREPMH